MASKRTKSTKTTRIEKEYDKIFVPYSLPYRGIYTDNDSLEQPSALEVVPTTASPAMETLPVTTGLHAKLERNI